MPYIIPTSALLWCLVLLPHSSLLHPFYTFLPHSQDFHFFCMVLFWTCNSSACLWVPISSCPTTTGNQSPFQWLPSIQTHIHRPGALPNSSSFGCLISGLWTPYPMAHTCSSKPPGCILLTCWGVHCSLSLEIFVTLIIHTDLTPASSWPTWTRLAVDALLPGWTQSWAEAPDCTLSCFRGPLWLTGWFVNVGDKTLT